MTTHGTPPDVSLDRLLTDWLDADAAPRAPESLETAFVEAVATTGQRPAWATTERWISMETRAQLGVMPRAVIFLLTIALLAIGAVGGFAIAGSLAEASDAGVSNGPITYTAADGAIYARSQDSSAEPIRLTDDDEITGAISWSPDGTRFSYESSTGEDGPRTITIRDADGSNPVEISEAVAWEPGWHRWSPDGQRLIFPAAYPALSDDQTGGCWQRGTFCGWRIFSAPTDGSAHAAVIGDPTLDARSAAWAPDGSFIVFAGSPAGSGAYYRLYRMDPDGNDVEVIGELSGAGYTFWKISVAPAGDRLVTQATSSHSDIYVVDIETGAATMVSDGKAEADEPVWSPDGRRIAYNRGSSGVSQPVIVDAETHDQTRLDVFMRVFGWSPDSSSLYGEPADEGLVVLDLDAETNPTGALEVLAGPNEADDPGWQPLLP